jgi:hypothetical protein
MACANWDVVIVGAGMAGLIAANTLQQAGMRVAVLDKSRGLGGRMATRRMEGGRLDHGAQFFTVSDERFRQLVQDWISAGAVRHLCNGFAGHQGRACYRGTRGMTDIGKHLTTDLNVFREHLVKTITTTDVGWSVHCKQGPSFNAKKVLFTPPVPQTLAILDRSDIALPSEAESILRPMGYHPCLVLLLKLDGPSHIPEPGGLKLDGEPVAWLADNRQKGISPDGVTVTVHAGHAFSTAHLEADPETIRDALLPTVQPHLGSNVIAWQTHRWRYAEPIECHAEPFFKAADLYFAGDIFGTAKVEGAALSGIAVAEQIIADSSLSLPNLHKF